MKPNDVRAMVLAISLLGLMHHLPYRLFGDEPRAVVTVSPKKGDLRAHVVVTGRIEPDAMVQIRPRIVGVIQRIMVDLGDRVEKGQLLAMLECPELETDLKRKGIVLEIAKAEIVQAERGIVAHETSLHGARAAIQEAKAELEKAQAEFTLKEKQVERLKKLVGSNVVSENQLIEAEQTLRLAKQTIQVAESAIERRKSDYREAEARHDQTRAMIEVLRRRMQLAEIEVQAAQLLMEFTSIKAPFSGVVTQRFAVVGQMITTPSQEGQSLFTLASLSKVRVIAGAPITALSLLQVGSEVQVSMEGKNQVGKVSRIAPYADSETQSIRIEIDLPNEDNRWIAGAAVKVQMPIARTQVWTIPRGAVLQREKETLCYLIEDGLARLCRIKIGAVEADRVEVQGMQIVGSKEEIKIDRIERLEIVQDPATVMEGQRVKPRPQP